MKKTHDNYYAGPIKIQVKPLELFFLERKKNVHLSRNLNYYRKAKSIFLIGYLNSTYNSVATPGG